MVSLAEGWHDPRGPERSSSSPNAQDALDFVRRGYIAVLDERTVALGRQMGLTDEQINSMLEPASQR